MATLENVFPTSSTLIDAFVSRRAKSSVMTDAILIATFALATAGCAQVSFPLPFTPVPLTLQTFGVLLTGAALGSRRGALSMLLYLVIGALGAPAFAGGTAGSAKLIGATGGYLLSYPLAAAMIGALAQRGWDRTAPKMAGALLLGNLLIFLPGVLWLSPFVGGIGMAIAKGFVPFIPGDLIKLGLASLLLPGAWALTAKLNSANPPQ